MNEANEDSNRKFSDLVEVSEKVIGLIFEKEFEQAVSLIERQRQSLSSGDSHRLTALAALVKREAGSLSEGIDLMQEVAREKPSWLPHLYRLSVFLMDAERWLDAGIVLDELILLSERKNDYYFVDDARFRRILCLKELRQDAGLDALKAKIPPGARFFVGDKSYGIEDLD
jgi:hypothetical protein